MPERPRDQLLDLPEGDPLSTEHLDEKVHLAEAHEQQLKRQLEVVERQKRELEELSRRQETFNTGKTELVDKLTRARVILEREIHDANKRVELLQIIDGNYALHLDTLDSINPKTWDGMDISKELTRALGAVDDARSEFTKSYPRIAAMPEHDSSAHESGYVADSGAGDSKDLLGWFKIGLAFSLPLIIFGLIALIVIASRMPAK